MHILTLNFSRYRNDRKIMEVMEKFKRYNIDIYCIQEIDVDSALKCFQSDFQVIVNWDLASKSRVGIVMLIKNGLKIKDTILVSNGRIIGAKIIIYKYEMYILNLGHYFERKEKCFSQKLSVT